jgi:hypothetical protein
MNCVPQIIDVFNRLFYCFLISSFRVVFDPLYGIRIPFTVVICFPVRCSCDMGREIGELSCRNWSWSTFFVESDMNRRHFYVRCRAISASVSWMACSTLSRVTRYCRTSLVRSQCSLLGKAGLQICWQMRLCVSTRAINSSSQLISCLLCWYRLLRFSSARASAQLIIGSSSLRVPRPRGKLDLCHASTGA